MKIQYVSDLHLEFRVNSQFIAQKLLVPVGDVLVIAGDTMYLKDVERFKKHKFFSFCSKNFKQTLLVPGNHEYYDDNLENYSDSFEIELRPNVRICQNKSVVIDDTEFILSTMWTRIPDKGWRKLQAGMIDFHAIRTGSRLLTASVYNQMHERDLAFIQSAVNESKAAHKVVVTHHVPTRLCVSPEFKGSTLGSCFTVDLTDYIESSGIDLWVYGHSHRSIDCIIGNTSVVSNQVGYTFYGEHNWNYRTDCAIELKKTRKYDHR